MGADCRPCGFRFRIRTPRACLTHHVHLFQGGRLNVEIGGHPRVSARFCLQRHSHSGDCSLWGTRSAWEEAGPEIPGWRDVPRCIRLPHWTPVCKWECSPKLQLQGQSQVVSLVDQQPKKDQPGSLGLQGVWNLQDSPDYASLKTSLLLGPLWLQLVLPPALDSHPSPVQQLYR